METFPKNKKPLFMWAGGKTKMVKFYNKSGIMPKNVSQYVEPFFGGGSMFLYVMDKYKPESAVINDINPSIVNIYNSIKFDVENFILEVDKLQAIYIPMNKEQRKKFYYEVRNDHAYHYENWSKTKEAAVLYFLMKTGFNGIWQCNKNTNGRFGTPSGLLNQKKEVYDKDVVRYWNEILQTTHIMCGDWKSVIEKFPDVEGSFYFFDPPYRGSFTSYAQEFSNVDQTKLVTFAKSVQKNSRVILCNDDTGDGFFQNQVEHLSIETYELTHTAGRRATDKDGKKKAKSVKEIAIHNCAPECLIFPNKDKDITKTENVKKKKQEDKGTYNDIFKN